MKVYLVVYPGDAGRIHTDIYTREAAIRLARDAAKTSYEVRTFGDHRDDADALADFIVVNWATEIEVIE